MTMKMHNTNRQWQKRNNQRHASGLCSVMEGWDE